MNVTDLRHYIRTYTHALPSEYCRSVVAHFNASTLRQTANGRGVRPGLELSSWIEMDLTSNSDEGANRYLLDAVLHYYRRYVSELALTLPVSPPTKMSHIIIKRYSHERKDQFQPHFDSLREVCNRYLVFLWYLNNVPEGGHTEFVDLGVSVAPEEGKLLIFPPYWMYQHAARPPVGGDKIIMSGYLEY